MILAGCQINPNDVNFHLQKSLEIFGENSADKVQSKKDKGIKVYPLCQLGLIQSVHCQSETLILNRLYRSPLGKQTLGLLKSEVFFFEVLLFCGSVILETLHVQYTCIVESV